MLRLFDEIAREEGSAHLPAELAAAYRLHAVPGWGDALLSCPDILGTIQLATAPYARIMSHNRVTAWTEGPTSVFETRYIGPPSVAQEWVAVLSAMLTLDGFRAGCGRDWLPEQIDIAASNIDALADLIDLNRVAVRTHQSATRFYFRTGDLAKRMAPHDTDTRLWKSLPGSNRLALYRVFDSIERAPQPTLDWIAQAFDTSPRTLQRHLATEGVTYRATLDGWRKAKALTLIEDESLLVREIAERLHYSDVPHFIRAFRRWTKQSPNAYRDSL